MLPYCVCIVVIFVLDISGLHSLPFETPSSVKQKILFFVDSCTVHEFTFLVLENNPFNLLDNVRDPERKWAAVKLLPLVSAA